MIERIRILRVVTVTLWAGILLVVAAALLLVPLLITINSRFALGSAQITALEKEGIVLDPIDVASLSSRVDVLLQKLAAPTTPAPMSYIDMIRNAAPRGIILSGFVFSTKENPSVEVSGTASTRQALQAFISTLEKRENVTLVESPVSNYVKSTNSAFTITIIFSAS